MFLITTERSRMELNERETLVKVEQQLNNSIENQAQITEDLREIFSRIDRESKILSTVKGDLQAHLETSLVQRENCNVKIESAIRDIGKAEVSLKTNIVSLESKIGEIVNKYEEERKKIDSIKVDYRLFEESIKSTIKTFKVTIAVFGIIMSILSPYITLLLSTWLKNP